MFNYSRFSGVRMLYIIFFIFLVMTVFGQETRNIELLYTDIQRPVFDIEQSNLAGISEFGYIFALPGMEAGVAYFTDSLEVYSVAINLGAVSIASDSQNLRIFAAFGCGSNGDGLYEFDVATHEFELIDWYFWPNFVKKLDDGYYFGYGLSTQESGLLYSADGDEWTAVPEFAGISVIDIEETGDGYLIAAAGSTIYMKNEGVWTSYNFEVPLEVNDIYVRWHPHSNEIYIASGDGTDSDAVFRVEHNNGVITGLTMINWFFQPNRLFEYNGMLVVGCLNNNGLYLVAPEEMSEPEQIGAELDFTEVYCFDTYPIYTHNFMMGTDVGVYLATDLGYNTDESECQPVIECNCYPNPFNPATNISFSLPLKSEIELLMYNARGQKVRSLAKGIFPDGIYNIGWNGDDDNGNIMSSGVYFYRLNVNGKSEIIKKCMLLK